MVGATTRDCPYSIFVGVNLCVRPHQSGKKGKETPRPTDTPLGEGNFKEVRAENHPPVQCRG